MKGLSNDVVGGGEGRERYGSGVLKLECMKKLCEKPLVARLV